MRRITHDSFLPLTALADSNNDEAMFILAYDSNGTLVREFGFSGARYLWNISLSNTTASFIGQDLSTIILPYTELQF